MASERGQNGDVVQTRKCELSAWDKREIQQTSNYAKQHEKKLKELADEFDSKGNLGLFWDSKVPEKDKWLFYFFTFRCSDPKEVKAEIEKYLKFYREMSEIASKIAAGDCGEDGEGTTQKSKDAYILIQELREHLTKLSRAAEAGEKTTGSQAVYDLHREFVAKHEKLESLIKKVECVAVTERWKRSLPIVSRLEKKVEESEAKHKSVCDKFDKLFNKHEEVTREKEEQERENESLCEQQRELLEKSSKQEKELKTQKQVNSELLQQIQSSEERHKSLSDQFEKLLAMNERLQQEKKEMEQKNQEKEQAAKELFDKNTMVLNLLKTMIEGENSESNTVA